MRMRNMKLNRRLNPINYRKLKAAIRYEMERSSDFTDGEVDIFLTMLDRVGRDDVSEFLLITTKFANLQISDAAWKFADKAIGEAEEEKKIRRGR